ncbi:TraA family conjugative transfer protein [Photobacterium leiognathi]|uniref:TraA family conjugative transfer protein n=1 Tax=Photobacterium leiognathi TaxID=553611 RepID=UPI002739D226|nr:TraA family conjugative transfer protein [Photobacterium leiognathi]
MKNVKEISMKLGLSDNAKMQLLFLFSLTVLMVVMQQYVFAGADETGKDFTEKLFAMLAGTLGKGIAIAFVVVGVIWGIAEQSLKAFIIGVGAALGMVYVPGMIAGMFTAVL